MSVTYVEVPEASDTVPVGYVIRQDPEPGLVGPDTVVTLYVSTGPSDVEVSVPLLRIIFTERKGSIVFERL